MPRRCWTGPLAADGGLGGGGGLAVGPLHLGKRQEQWSISKCLSLPTAAQATPMHCCLGIPCEEVEEAPAAAAEALH